ncbi:DUF4116 domain-containing protein [Gammaproteobacteria bacterium]|nr:DUF4116 domain-containing protein [Gammaproteobacteria bacterium]
MTYINRKYIETTTPKDINDDDHVDGIDDPRINDVLLDRNTEENYWSNGFQLEVEDGTWYEIYLSERAHGDGLRSYKDLDNKESEMINALQNLYKGSNFEYFKDYGQITFYVSQKEEILTWDRLLSSVEAIYKNNSLNQDIEEDDYSHNLKFLTELFQTLDKAINNQSKEPIIDKGLIIEQIKNRELDYWNINEEYRSDREFNLDLLKIYPYAFKMILDKFKSDKEIVMAVVCQSGEELRYASHELQSDKDIVLKAFKNYEWAFEYAGDDLKSDREFVLAAIKINACAYAEVSKQLKLDREIALLAANTSNNYVFSHVPEIFRADKNFIMESLKGSKALNGRLTEFIPDEHRADREIMTMAMKKSGGMALEFASDELKNDIEFFLESPSLEIAYFYASESIKSQREILLKILEKEKGWRALQNAPKKLRSDKEIVLKAIKIEPVALTFADKKLHSDKDLIAAGGIVEVD